MLSIIVLHYGEHQVDMTRQCLDVLRERTVGDHEIVLWVNGDLSADYNRPLQPTLGTEERKSLAAAYNAALGHVHGDMVAILHNDCFVTQGWNLPLEKEALAGNVAFPVVETNREMAAARGVACVQDWMPPSCCFVIGKDELERLAGWDERFEFCHFEDMDLFKRATDAGMRLVQCPATVMHIRGVTRADQVDAANAALKINELRYARKHGTREGEFYSAPLPVLETIFKETTNVDLH